MELPMAAEVELCFSGYNSSVEASEVGWPYWSPVTAWAQFACEDHINNTLETMLWDFDSCAATPEAYGLAGSLPETPEICSSAAGGVSMECEIPKTADALVATGIGEGEKGLRLFHLLSAAAEAIFGGDLNRRELARVILARLKQLLPPAATTDAAASLERLVTHFSEALHRLLVDDSDAASVNGPIFSLAEATVASHLLHDMSPYVNFGHFTANQAILEAIGSERRVHIVDFDAVEGAQWPPLMQAMVSRTDGVPRPSQLKITALVGRGKKAAAAAQETGRRLSEYAASIGLPFAFVQCRVDRKGQFQATAVRVVMGDYLVFNCAIHTPYHEHHSASSIGSFLAVAQALGARLVTVVEEEKERGRDDIFGKVGTFKEELERYCAIWDALETGHAKQGGQGRWSRPWSWDLGSPEQWRACFARRRGEGFQVGGVDGCPWI
ncbi:hypothetical protein HPP92_001934 [Vanilla planifolia]|uniref:Nodulation-signaling pathway 2 protein n=1 Tax=Vanilla planifolia TaxID=51239 RepID=A0A835VHS1_VANPL|nr:hypothetical protein HPP92_002176 [Vanilla planifolia]KAG0501862.1 hypothetical protein HPP92_001934 [Vanilla planifolia]